MKLQFGNLAEAVYKQWKRRGDTLYTSLKETVVATVNDPSSGKGNPLEMGDGKLFCRSFGQGLFFIYSIEGECVRVEAISSPEDIASKTDAGQHRAAIDLMRRFMDDGRPKLGIFWYDYVGNVLFGVEKGDARLYSSQGRLSTYPKLHKTFWQKMHHKAVASGDKDSIFFNEHDYTQIPRGRVFLEDGVYYVNVGEWINGFINGKKCIDAGKLRELVIDEFNLPEDFEFRQDEHWDIGHGWSEVQF